MGNRLSKIYTRTGDDGTTGLGDGSRTPKDAARVEAYGTVDEANSLIGLVLAGSAVPDTVRECLTEVQHDLFELGGELCIPGHSAVTQDFIDRLERDLDALNADLPKLKEFILVGDWGTCCFGGNPKITDVVAVKIVGDQTVDYGYSVRRVVGTFRLNKSTRRTNEKDIPQVFYEIEAEQVR